MSVLTRQVPEVFEPLLYPSRYKGAFGGRGSGKSHFFAEQLIEECIDNHVRAICAREIQNSIDDSVKQLLEDKIYKFGLQDAFRITDREISGPNESLLVFRGLQKHLVNSVKSMEGFNRLWVEEAQTVSQHSIDVITPTIREEESEIWFSWNPSSPTDAIDKFLRKRPPEGAIVVRANYLDNPFFPESLREDMEADKTSDYAKYEHVWLGEYQDVSDMQFISREVIKAARDRQSPLPEEPRIMGLDVARFGDDKTVLILRHGHKVRKIWDWSKLDTMQTAAKTAELCDRHTPQALFVDGVGVGGGVVDRLRMLGVKVIDVNAGGRAMRDTRYGNKRAEMWANMRDWLRDVGEIPDHDHLEMELQSPEYRYDNQNRVFLEKKEDMKKRGMPSPDYADALALTFAQPVRQRMQGNRPKKNWHKDYNPLAGV